MNFNVSKYYFIVSDEDDKSAKGVYEDIVRRRCEIKNRKSEYIDVNSKNDFKNALKKISKESKENGEFPYIHLECHGGQKGIKLKSSANIYWNEFADLLTQVNIASKNHLFISVASCYGGYLALPIIRKTLQGKTSRAPVCGYVGPVDEITYGNIEEGFANFFDTLIASSDMDKAIEQLNIHSRYEKGYSYNSCSNIFLDVIDYFLENDIAKKFDSKVSFLSHVYELSMNRFRETGRLPPGKDFNNIATLISSKEFYLGFFNELRKNFFMIDLYPENEERFEKISDIKNWENHIKRIR